jgi:hypothetical protein
MTNFPAGRLVLSARRCALLVLAVATIAGCGGLVGGKAGDDRVAPESVVTSTVDEPAASASATTETAPVQTAPVQTAPVQTGAAQADTGRQEQATAPVEPGGTLVDGSTVSAELTRAGQKDKFTLDLGDAREFYVTDMEGDDIQLQVFSDVDGEALGFSSVALSFGTTIFKMTKAGRHRLEVWGNPNVVGAYSFRIATVKVRTFPATIGLKIGEGSPAGAGRLDVPGRIDRFELASDGATGIRILGNAETCTGVEVELYGAAEKKVANARQPYPLCGEFTLPFSNGDGRYALVVRSPAAKTAPYSFQITRAG